MKNLSDAVVCTIMMAMWFLIYKSTSFEITLILLITWLGVGIYQRIDSGGNK